MFNMILAFVVVFGLFFFGTKAIVEMTQKERWSLTKYMVYCTICTVLALAALTAIVVLF